MSFSFAGPPNPKMNNSNLSISQKRKNIMQTTAKKIILQKITFLSQIRILPLGKGGKEKEKRRGKEKREWGRRGGYQAL